VMTTTRAVAEGRSGGRTVRSERVAGRVGLISECVSRVRWAMCVGHKCSFFVSLAQ
jgi:hypothetical protein